MKINTKELEELCSDVAIITQDYKDLHFDEIPILYKGKNRFESIMLGSHLYIDSHESIIYRLQTIVSSDVYALFCEGKISYYNLLKTAKNIFLVLYDTDLEFIKAYFFNFSLIPEEFLPLEDSYLVDPPNYQTQKQQLNEFLFAKHFTQSHYALLLNRDEPLSSINRKPKNPVFKSSITYKIKNKSYSI